VREILLAFAALVRQHGGVSQAATRPPQTPDQAVALVAMASPEAGHHPPCGEEADTMFGLPVAALDLGLRLLMAVLAGSILGMNREVHHKPAGLRTHALVALGTALSTVLIWETTQHDPQAVSRVMQGLVTGVGFLGAGVIMHREAEHHVEGLTTAASLWVTAIFGIVCGAGQGGLLLLGLGLALVVLLLGGPVEQACARWLSRRRPPAPPV
jgi:putative Mg2+ transporter-C (MgtC) family protein